MDETVSDFSRFKNHLGRKHGYKFYGIAIIIVIIMSCNLIEQTLNRNSSLYYVFTNM